MKEQEEQKSEDKKTETSVPAKPLELVQSVKVPIDKPSLGRIVIYNTTKSDRSRMTEQSSRGMSNVQMQLPAVVVGIFEAYQAGDTGECNLKVFFDGYAELWVTSASRGSGEGQWNWPVKT